jgi:di/tricarboxylate transporter
MTLKGLDEPTRRITAAANRLVLALLAVAFILGPAILIPRLHEIFPQFKAGAIALVLTGFGLSALITLALLVSVWRSGR